jgi:hypothetical protein
VFEVLELMKGFGLYSEQPSANFDLDIRRRGELDLEEELDPDGE